MDYLPVALSDAPVQAKPACCYNCGEDSICVQTPPSYKGLLHANGNFGKKLLCGSCWAPFLHHLHPHEDGPRTWLVWHKELVAKWHEALDFNALIFFKISNQVPLVCISAGDATLLKLKAGAPDYPLFSDFRLFEVAPHDGATPPSIDHDVVLELRPGGLQDGSGVVPAPKRLRVCDKSWGRAHFASEHVRLQVADPFHTIPQEFRSPPTTDQKGILEALAMTGDSLASRLVRAGLGRKLTATVFCHDDPDACLFGAVANLMPWIPHLRQTVPLAGPHSVRQFNGWCISNDLALSLELASGMTFADIGTMQHSFVIYEHTPANERPAIHLPSSSTFPKVTVYRSSPSAVVEIGHWFALKCVAPKSFHIFDSSVGVVVACTHVELLAALKPISSCFMFVPNTRGNGDVGMDSNAYNLLGAGAPRPNGSTSGEDEMLFRGPVFSVDHDSFRSSHMRL